MKTPKKLVKRPAQAIAETLPFRDINPISPGLVIVNVIDLGLTQYARTAIEQVVLDRKGDLDMVMPDADGLLSIHSGNPRQMDVAMRLADAHKHLEDSMGHKFKSYGNHSNFNWCSCEGMTVLLPIIKRSPNWIITLEQEISNPITPAVSAGLMQIRNAAVSAGTWVILFLVLSTNKDIPDLYEMCDEYIEIKSCDAAPGSQFAFSAMVFGLRHLNPFGIGHVFCDVRFAGGLFHYTYIPFVSCDLETRIMWLMRGQGMTLEDIGKKMGGINKSNVQRRLHKLPQPRFIKMREGWLERHLELLDLNKPADAISDDEDDREGDE